MAILQMPAPASTPALLNQTRRWVVKTKAQWGEPWQVSEYLVPVRCIHSVGPSNSSAEFALAVGTLKREDRQAFADELMRDLLGRYVLIEARPDNGAAYPVWVGIILEDQLALKGVTANRTESGDQGILAFGLEVLLDRRPITTGVIWQDSQVRRIGVAPVHNERHQLGLAPLGNRSTDKHPVQDQRLGGYDEAYTFSNEGQTWSALEILEYLIAHHPPPGPAFRLDGQHADLANLFPTIDLRHRTIRQALDSLVDRRRGYGWCIRVNAYNLAEPVAVHVFSVFGRSLEIGGGSWSANRDQVLIDFDEDLTVDSLDRVRDRDKRYDRVVVRGRPILSCFTVSPADGTLFEGWTGSEETAFQAAEAEHRNEERFARVYRFFRIPPEWNWMASTGAGGSDPFYLANPRVTLGGSIIQDPANQGASTQPPVWMHARSLEQYLPIFETAGADGAEPRPIKPMIFVPVDDLYYRLDDMPDDLGVPSAGLSIPRREFGFVVQARPPELLSLNHFAAGDGSLDWEEMIVTVAARTDQCIEARVNITAEYATGRDLVIDVPDAETWIILPGTVIGVQAGALLRYQSDTWVLRDDSQRLRNIANVAYEWYRVDRAVMRLKLRNADPIARVGQYLIDSGPVSRSRPLETIVSRVTLDLDRRTQTIDTGWAELDAQAFEAGTFDPRL